MGYKRALKALNLEYTDQIPLLGDMAVGRRMSQKLTGMNRKERTKYIRALYEALEVDLIYAQNSIIEPSYNPFIQSRRPRKTIYGDSDYFRKRLGDFGDAFHLAYRGMKLSQSPVVSQLWVVERPFQTYPELLEYLERWDPREQETRSVKELTEKHSTFLTKCQDLLADVTLVAGVTYVSLWTFFIIHLGYPNLTRLIHQNLDILLEALNKFSEVTRTYMEAWARTGIKALVQHDDLATENGPMMSPRWFRKYLFPLYREMWKPLKDKGIKVINISDGNHTLLFDGYAEAGSDGFKVNEDARLSHADLEHLYETWGGKKILIFAPNREILLYGRKKETIAEIEFLTSQAKKYNGAFLHGINSQHHPTTAYRAWINNRGRS